MEFLIIQVELTQLLAWVGKLFMWAGAVSLGASILRVILDHLEEPLHIWTSNPRLFATLDKVEATLAWLSVSLAKLGTKKGQVMEAITTIAETKPKELVQAAKTLAEEQAIKEEKPDILVVEVKEEKQQ